MNWGFGSYSSLIARFEGLVQFISLKRTTIRNPATRSTAKLFTIRGRSRSKAGQIAFVPGSMNNFGPTIRTTTRTISSRAWRWLQTDSEISLRALVLTDEQELIPTVFTKRLILTDRLSTLFGS